MSNTELTSTLQLLKEQVLNLLNDLMDIFPNENDILFARLFFETQADPQLIMNGFIEWVYPWKKEILEKNEEFFEKSDRIFGPIDSSKLERFKKMWKEGQLDNDEKEAVWKYFQVYIKLIDKYKKLI